MRTFEIAIQRRIDRKVDENLVARWPVVVEWMASGLELPLRREGDFIPPDEKKQWEGLASPHMYGIFLGKAVFHDAGVAAAFDEALTGATDPLHVLLFVEADEWKSLRWERLAAPFDGDNWKPLALEERTS
jgi:hypothetical protein